MAKLMPLEFYQEKLDAFRKKNKYAKNWTLRIERKTNKHPDCGGHLWGWYEMWPLGIELGIWSYDSSDLACIDIDEWNRRAKSKEGADDTK